MKIAIAGGGVIGASIAYHLRKAGASVVLIERGEIGGEASGAAAGMLIAPLEDTANAGFNALRNASLAMYPTLIEEIATQSGVDFEHKRPGMLRTARTEAAARAMQAVARDNGLDWVEGSVLRDLEPALSPDILGAAYCETDADLNPSLWTMALAAAAEYLGAEVVTGAAVTVFSGDGGRLREVSTEVGDYRADAFVLAAGPWTELLTMHLDSPAFATPPMRGQMIAYASEVLRHAIWGEDGYLIPKPRGELWAGATVEDAGFEKTNTVNAIAQMQAMATALVPSLVEATVARTWAGLRPGSPDGMPIVGRLPGYDNAYVATGHFRNGILLAPITGALMADLILNDRLDPLLEPFSAERFAR